MNQSSQINVRPVKAEDFCEIEKLMGKLAESKQKQMFTTVEQLIEDNSSKYFECLVAEAECENQVEIVGFLMFNFGYSSWEGKITYLEDAYFDDRFGKAKEIAEKLLSHVAKESTKNGCAWIRFFAPNCSKEVEIYKTLGVQDVTDKYDYHYWTLDEESMKRMSATC